MEITEYINHPERLDRDTLYELRTMLAQHPYFQPGRLLMLQNLYLLHDSAFNEELRRSAIYVTDRKVLFNMVEAAHYQLKRAESQKPKANEPKQDRTATLIDSFLESIPVEKEADEQKPKRRPTPADAAIDYVAYLLESEEYNETEQTPQMKGQDLIDNFLEQERGRILLSELPEQPQDETTGDTSNEAADDADNEEEYFTETLARIYIKQGRYEKALGIIGRLSAKYPQKNAYFADQIRFLEKLIINNNNKNKK